MKTAEQIVTDWCEDYLEMTVDPEYGMGRGALAMRDAIAAAIAERDAEIDRLRAVADAARKLFHDPRSMRWDTPGFDAVWKGLQDALDAPDTKGAPNA